MPRLTNITLIISLAILSHQVSSKTITDTITGACLTASLKNLIAQGCNFAPKPEVYRALLQYSKSTQSFNFGQATQEEAAEQFPSPKYISGYFGKAIAQPMTPVSGETGAGIQYLKTLVTIGMDNIHLCSDQGIYADWAITSSKIVIKNQYIQDFSKDDLRNAGW